MIEQLALGLSIAIVGAITVGAVWGESLLPTAGVSRSALGWAAIIATAFGVRLVLW